MNDFVSGKQASEILNVHQRTLMNWDKKGAIEVIRTPGNKRLYNVKKFLKTNNINCEPNIIRDCCDFKINDIKEKIDICYVRVSSHGQKDDLGRQHEYMASLYPNTKIIDDIGSGINFKRRGLKKIIQLAISGKLNKLIIVHKDRLARFGYDLIEFLIKEYSNGEIIITNKNKEDEPEEELVKDVLQIMNVFVAKMNGMRKYKKLINVEDTNNDDDVVV